MPPTSKSAWTNFERWIATAWSIILGETTTRTPLSGMNSGHGCGDVIVRPHLGLDVVIEAKYRAANVQHTLFDNVIKDAERHGKNPDCALLYTKVKRRLDKDTLVTLKAIQFHRIMQVPGVLDLFKTKPTE